MNKSSSNYLSVFYLIFSIKFNLCFFNKQYNEFTHITRRIHDVKAGFDHFHNPTIGVFRKMNRTINILLFI